MNHDVAAGMADSMPGGGPAICRKAAPMWDADAGAPSTCAAEEVGGGGGLSFGEVGGRAVDWQLGEME